MKEENKEIMKSVSVQLGVKIKCQCSYQQPKVKLFEAKGKSPGESEAGAQTRVVSPPQERLEFLALEKQSRHAGGGSLSRLDTSCITAWGYEVGEAHGLPPE